MKITVNQSELMTAISVVLKGVGKNATLPVLAGIYAEAVGNDLILESTDLTKSIKYSIPALVEEEGKTVFSGSLLMEIIKKLPNAAITIQESGDNALIFCDSVSYDIRTMDPSDFPNFPNVEPTQELIVPFHDFVAMVKRVSIAVSRDESRAILMGILLDVGGGTLRMVATDSFRLALDEMDVVGYVGNDFSAVIGGEFMRELTTLPKSEDPISIGLTENQVVVRYRNTELVNRRVAGKYPNYQQLIATEFTTEATADRDDLCKAVERVSVVADNASVVRLVIDLDAPLIQVSTVSQDKGRAQQNITCEGMGETMELGYNFRFLQDGLAAAPSDKVKLCIQDPCKPGIIRAMDGSPYLYLLMPMVFNS